MTTIENIIKLKNDLIRITIKEDTTAIKDAMKLKKETEEFYKNGDTYTNTKGVQPKYLNLLLKPFGNIFDSPVLLEIIPIGLNNMCHKNCERFCGLTTEFKPRSGYNITACKCGRLRCMEVHTVVENIQDGKLYDITPDMCDEKNKWFVPFNKHIPFKLMVYFVGRKFDHYKTGERICRCSNWNIDEADRFEVDDLIKFYKKVCKTNFVFM